MEPSFIGEICKFWVNNSHVVPEKDGYKNGIFSRNSLIQLDPLETVLFYTASVSTALFQVNLLSEIDPGESTFSSSLKTV
jgi:hypothetical protein